MSTIEKFLASPSCSFEDVTDTLLARGGPKKDEVQDVQTSIDDGDPSGEVAGQESGCTDDGEGVAVVVDRPEEKEIGVAVADSAADAAQAVEVGTDAGVRTERPAAVESASAYDEEDVPEPRRRRRRR